MPAGLMQLSEMAENAPRDHRQFELERLVDREPTQPQELTAVLDLTGDVLVFNNEETSIEPERADRRRDRAADIGQMIERGRETRFEEARPARRRRAVRGRVSSSASLSMLPRSPSASAPSRPRR